MKQQTNSCVARWVAAACAIWTLPAAHAAGSSSEGKVTWENPAPFPYQIQVDSFGGCVTDPGLRSFTVDPGATGDKAKSYAIKISPGCSARSLNIVWKYATKISDGIFSSFEQALVLTYKEKDVSVSGAKGRLEYVASDELGHKIRLLPKAYCGSKQESCNWVPWSGQEVNDWYSFDTTNVKIVPGNPVVYVLRKNKWVPR
ncbi:hypothetical protein [Bordetella bronchialis]|uniref:hypothetical protein n=1 Tax=Bordetella bronchialis TaxID=463025 RepID=UPI000A47EDAB|nr:hypothetical protein [Bordetella bronchialis]